MSKTLVEKINEVIEGHDDAEFFPVEVTERGVTGAAGGIDDPGVNVPALLEEVDELRKKVETLNKDLQKSWDENYQTMRDYRAEDEYAHELENVIHDAIVSLRMLVATCNERGLHVETIMLEGVKSKLQDNFSDAQSDRMQF